MSLPKSEIPCEILGKYIKEHWINFACTVLIGLRLDNNDQFQIVHMVLYPDLAVNFPSEFEGMKVVIEQGTQPN